MKLGARREGGRRGKLDGDKLLDIERINIRLRTHEGPLRHNPVQCLCWVKAVPEDVRVSVIAWCRTSNAAPLHPPILHTTTPLWSNWEAIRRWVDENVRNHAISISIRKGRGREVQVEIDDERSESRVEEHDHLIHPVIAVLARQLIWSASQRPQRIHHESSYPHVVQPH